MTHIMLYGSRAAAYGGHAEKTETTGSADATAGGDRFFHGLGGIVTKTTLLSVPGVEYPARYAGVE